MASPTEMRTMTTWSRVMRGSVSPEGDIEDYITGGPPEWRELMRASGALDVLTAAYRRAIEDALPASVSLDGTQFVGPAQPDDDEWDGYCVDEGGELDIEEIVQGVDLAEIAEEHDVITLGEVGRDILRSRAKNPSSAASRAMLRAGVRPMARVQIGGEGQPQSVYWAVEVARALAARPGRGRSREH